MISSGFANGINAGIGAAQAAASRLAAIAAQAIAAKAQIHSPSRVTRRLGEYTGEGYALGIEDMYRQVERASESITVLPEAASSGISGGITIESSSTSGMDGGTYVIEVPVALDGKTIARVTAPYTRSELSKLNIRQQRRMGYA